jgi:hypothetical protein
LQQGRPLYDHPPTATATGRRRSWSRTYAEDTCNQPATKLIDYTTLHILLCILFNLFPRTRACRIEDPLLHVRSRSILECSSSSSSPFLMYRSHSELDFTMSLSLTSLLCCNSGLELRGAIGRRRSYQLPVQAQHTREQKFSKVLATSSIDADMAWSLDLRA